MKLLLLSIFALAPLYLSSAEVISLEEFNDIIQSVGLPKPAADIYSYLAECTTDFTREEFAMFLAQLMHESVNFKYTVEIPCQTGNKCAGMYVDKVGLPGNSYYGRGFINMRFGKNYKDASHALFGDDRLLNNPDLVATDTKIAVFVSVWYWKTHVRPKIKGKENQFGATTKAIAENECGGDNKNLKNVAIDRWLIYLDVARILHIKKKAVENGCYNCAADGRYCL